MTVLTFGSKGYFNQQLFLTKKVISLVLGDSFNQPIVLNKNLLKIVFGEKYDQLICANSNMTMLTFGFRFDKPIDLTEKILHLEFGAFFNQKINVSKNITHLTFGRCFNQSIILTIRIKKLVFETVLGLGQGQSWQSTIIPQNVEHLTFLCNNYNVIDNIPNGVKKITLGKYTDLLDNLPRNITHVDTHISPFIQW